MQVPIKDIIVKKRIRKDMGDIGALAESLKIYGQISPIVISRKGILIAGGRRLEAAKLLGWRTINAVVSETSGELEQLELEVEENIQRRDFSMEEVSEATQKIYRLQNPGFFRRLLNRIIRFFKKLLAALFSALEKKR
ncbi:MAG: ParB N-terminal domain-containing protein [Treponema sp.]|jgi:ParB family chromosome partitioning protein|nr:ParB N-terminal domain-containing protein [Treponema sp.]